MGMMSFRLTADLPGYPGDFAAAVVILARGPWNQPGDARMRCASFLREPKSADPIPLVERTINGDVSLPHSCTTPDAFGVIVISHRI